MNFDPGNKIEQRTRTERSTITWGHLVLRRTVNSSRRSAQRSASSIRLARADPLPLSSSSPTYSRTRQTRPSDSTNGK